MRERERRLLRKRLDVELRPYRQAGKELNPTNGLLRVIRHALGVPAAEIAEKMGVCQSVVFDIEARELSNAVMMQSIERMARAMGCMLVYGIVPEHGETLENLSEERLWKETLANRERKTRNGEQGTGVRDRKTGNREQGTGVGDRGAAISSGNSAISPDDVALSEEPRDDGLGRSGTEMADALTPGVLGTKEELEAAAPAASIVRRLEQFRNWFKPEPRT
jgi:hypothetical protein